MGQVLYHCQTKSLRQAPKPKANFLFLVNKDSNINRIVFNKKNIAIRSYEH